MNINNYPNRYNQNFEAIKKDYPKMNKNYELDTDDLIHRLWNTDSEDLKNFIETKAAPVKTESQNYKAYQYDKLLLVRSTAKPALDLEDNLKFLSNYSFAPKYKNWLKIGENDFISILELSPQELIPYQKVASAVPAETKQKFKNEMKSLAEKNLLISSAFTNKEAYFVTKDLKNIILADCMDIKQISETDKPQMLENIKNWKL